MCLMKDEVNSRINDPTIFSTSNKKVCKKYFFMILMVTKMKSDQNKQKTKTLFMSEFFTNYFCGRKVGFAQFVKLHW